MRWIASILCVAACLTTPLRAADVDEFRVKREAAYAFTRKPTVAIDGDRVTIRFAAKGYCDVTVAVEDSGGKIIRHLASGVLGKNAPPPLQAGALTQTLIWDSKDDQGRYVKDLAAHTVRVSLGLKPQFEKTLFWSPHKQRSGMPLVAAGPEGIYVYDGIGVDYVRLFDHDGEYVRTVYPFPAAKLESVKGLRWHDFPQGYRRALKESGYQQTLLTSGVNDSIYDKLGRTGQGVSGLAVRGGRIAVAYEHLNRLSTEGSTPPGVALKGPKTGFIVQTRGYGGYDQGSKVIGPTSLAFSPDGKTVYMTGFLWHHRGNQGGAFHTVLKTDFAIGEKMSVFAGSVERKQFGRGDDRLAVPMSVACDAAGRVYVSDFLNDRIQVFEPDGTLLKSIATPKPAKVLVHQKTGEIFAFSWPPMGVPSDAWKAYDYEPEAVKPTLTRFTAFPAAKKVSAEPFPLGPAGNSRVYEMGQRYSIELDSWAKGPDPTFWVSARVFVATRADHRILYIDHRNVMAYDKWADGVRIMRKIDGNWTRVSRFGQRAAKAVKRIAPIKHNIQHMYVNPVDGKLYVGEADSGATIKCFKRLAVIDPVSGEIRFQDLPFNALDVAFDLNGLIYLRTTDVVARYDARTWREVPWDYGEELDKVTCGIYGRTAAVIGGLVVPSVSPVCFHQGGMSVSAKGNLAMACSNRPKGRTTHHDFEIFGKETRYGKPYRPPMFPGREESSTSASVHVWDKHGKQIHTDAVAGLQQLDGLHIDRDDNIYVMATPTRVIDGKPYFNVMSETLIKFRPGRAKIVQSSEKRSPIPLAKADLPKRPPDLIRGGSRIWVEGAEWFYGGVGYAGFNTRHAGGGCACWFARSTLDYFARSFAPEPQQYSVAVLDSGGNLITRVGRYGNVDDGRPTDPKGGPESPRSLGGDEVALFHAAFVGTHTDRRLYIADLGNARILSVRLNYHATESVPLKAAK